MGNPLSEETRAMNRALSERVRRLLQEKHSKSMPLVYRHDDGCYYTHYPDGRVVKESFTDDPDAERVRWQERESSS